MLDVNGRWHRLDASLVLLESADPQAVGLIGADITERRQIETRLREREEQLRQALRMEVVGRLASGIAHDFGNLLTIIIGASSRMLDDLADDSPTRAHAQSIQLTAERAASLVRQLLEFGRQRADAPAIIDLNAVVQETEELLHRLLGEHIELRTISGSGLWAVRADRTQVEQVLLNLAANGRDAMPGGGRLTIETRNVGGSPRTGRPSGPCVVVSVTDTGIGMDAATQAHAFEPFFTTKAVGQGTGLGLANVHNIVKENGGWTELSSAVGRGTTVTFGLPRADGATTASSLQPSASVGGDETLLVVEDEDGVRELVRDILSLAGYHVLEAALPSEAHRVSREFGGPIRLLVTDVVMPEMSGLDLSVLLRAHRPDLQVMYMSGFPEPTVGGGTGQPPGAHFIAKPFDRQGLLRAVRRAIDDTPAID